MKRIAHGLIRRVRKLHRFSRLAFQLGAVTMLCFYITALFAYLLAPQGDYLAVMNIYRGCLEAAPASLAAGVCAGLLGDLMLRSRGGGEDRPDKKG